MEYTRSGSSSSSTDESVINYKEKKPCERCGSNANDDLIMTCFNCRVTREHIYCAKVLLRTVPDMWICEECRSSTRVLFINHNVAKYCNETANSRCCNHASNQVSVASRTSRVDGQNTGSKHSDSNTHSDSESAT